MTNLINFLNANFVEKAGNYKGILKIDELIEQILKIEEIEQSVYNYFENDGIGKKQIMLCNTETFEFFSIRFTKNNKYQLEKIEIYNDDTGTCLYSQNIKYI